MLSAKGREYRDDAMLACLQAKCYGKMTGRLVVSLEFRRKDKRAYDLDNFAKAVLDALQHGGIIEDDGLIDHLTLVRGPVGDDCVIVIIEDLTKGKE